MPSVFKEKGEYRHHEQVCNEDLIAYLCSKFNSSALWFTITAKSVFCNAVLAKFGDVNFIINAAGTCVEIAFAKADSEKLAPVVGTIMQWEKFTKSDNPFCVQVDRDGRRSLLFETGLQPRSGFRNRFSKYELKITEI